MQNFSEYKIKQIVLLNNRIFSLRKTLHILENKLNVFPNSTNYNLFIPAL